MKSGILSFNKGLLKQNSRSVLWISIFFTLALLVVLPLGIWMVIMNEGSFEPYILGKNENTLFTFSYAFQYILYIAFPVLTGVVLTNYMTKKGSADFMHSLPFKRSTLLTHVYAAGAAALALPVIATAFVLAFMRPFLEPAFYTLNDIASWAGVSLLVILFVFIVTVFVGLLIGPALLQGAMAYGVLIVPGAAIALVLANASYYINGLAADAYIEKVMTKGVFFVRAAAIADQPFSSLELLLYSLFGILLAVVSYYVYKVRPAEATDETIVFPVFRSLFIFAFTLCAMLIGGLYFAEMLNGALGWMVVGYVLGAFAGYTILQMIVQKTLRLVWPWKGFAVYAVSIAVLLIPASIYASLYEKKVPASEDIAKVYVSNNTNYDVSPAGNIPDSVAVDAKSMGYMQEEQSIKQAVALHRSLMKEGKPAERRYGYPVAIAYELKDGKRIERQYYADGGKIEQLTSQLADNREFKRATHPVFALSRPDKVTYLSIPDYRAGRRDLRITDEKEIKLMLDAIRKDALTESSRVFSNYDFSYAGEVQIWFTDGEMMSAPITLDQEQTINLIRNKLKGGSSFSSPESVAEAFILTTDTAERREQVTDYINEKMMTDREIKLTDIPVPAEKVSDPTEMKRLLDPAGLTQHSSRTLLIKWKEGHELSAVGIKE